MKHPFGLALTLSVGTHILVGVWAYWLPTLSRAATDPDWGSTRIEIGRFPPLSTHRDPYTRPPAPIEGPRPPDVPEEYLRLPPVPPPPRVTPQPPPLDSFDTVPVPRAAVSSPTVLDNPPPEYPPAARRKGMEGRAILLVRVSAEGKPLDISILRSSGHPILDQAAKEGVLRWTFLPATRGGRPVEGEVEVPIRFQLEGPPG